VNREIIIKVCTGTSGIASGGGEVLSAFRSIIASSDIEATICERCSAHQSGCRGLCKKDVLVDVIINGDKTTYMHIKPDMANTIFEEHIMHGRPVAAWIADREYHEFHAKQTKVVLSSCGEIDPEDIHSYRAVGGYDASCKAVLSMSPEAIISTVRQSNLRGRGGGGFPTDLKWELCARSVSDTKYVICNGNESDPGAFMDTSLMEGNPHSVIEGMIICAKAVGSHLGIIYTKSEYALSVNRLQRAIEQGYQMGYLGKGIFGSPFDFELKVFQGAGAFVCGEATALMRSIEGKRGMPTSKMWRTAEKGLWEKPTVLNNVETFANIPKIILKGAPWFRKLGTERSGGTKVFSLSGTVKNTGLIEVPMGTPLREIIFDIGGGVEGGKAFKGVHIGGPTGGCLPAGMLDTEVDYESLAQAGSMMGSGGMVVLDESNCIVNTAKFFVEISQTESCGKCTPCRIGTKRMLEILQRITAGQGKEGDLDLLEELAQYIRATSLCGLGMTAPNPVLSTLRYFRDEYEQHVRKKKCPAAVCRDLITYSVLGQNCTGCGACRRACPADAIRGIRKKPHRIDQELCIKCGTCSDACKFNAIMRA
jgi:NADH-quinone oxidoreductase subunit F